MRKPVFERKPGPIRWLDRYADETLKACDETWKRAAGLDTAVSDSVAQGLAFLVHSAYDSLSTSKAIGYGSDDYAASIAYIAGATAQWFRDRGFAEWFCLAAGSLFNTSRPRIKAERIRRVNRKHMNRKHRKAAS